MTSRATFVLNGALSRDGGFGSFCFAGDTSTGGTGGMLFFFKDGIDLLFHFLVKRLFRHKLGLAFYAVLLFLVNDPALGAHLFILLVCVCFIPLLGSVLFENKRGSTVLTELVLFFIFSLAFLARSHGCLLLSLPSATVTWGLAVLKEHVSKKEKEVDPGTGMALMMS